MSFIDRVDPELRAGLDFFPPDLLDLKDIPGTRARFAVQFASLPAAAVEGVVSEDRLIPGPVGDPDLHIRVYQPRPRRMHLPALLWIHGGGYVLGDVEGEDAAARQLAQAVECVVVSVDYRLAPEHPFPAPLEDCYAALTWLAGQAGGQTTARASSPDCQPIRIDAELTGLSPQPRERRIAILKRRGKGMLRGQAIIH